MNAINNFPVMMEDIDTCGKIFGPNIYRLKGNTVCTKPKAVVNDYINIPKRSNYTNQNIYICVNIMYIQGHAFLVTISKTIKTFTIQ